MNATTIFRAYRKARALSRWNVYDRKAWRNTSAFLARLERICQEYDAMKAAKEHSGK